VEKGRKKEEVATGKAMHFGTRRQFSAFRVNEVYDKEEIRRCWERFVTTGEIDRNTIREIVADSWERSKRLGINPYMKRIGDGLERPEVLEDRTNRIIAEISDPFLDILSLTLKSSHYAISIFDRKGFKIKSRASGELRKRFEEVGNVTGVSFSEESIGTNAVGLALIYDMPVQMIGPENYIRLFHHVMITAIPIKDTKSNTVGILSISSWKRITDMNTLLGMAFASVKSIENSLRLRKAYEEKKYLADLLESSIENMSEGLITIDKDGRILQINSISEEILGLKKEKDKGKSIFNFLELDPTILGERKEEVSSISKHRKIQCLLNISPISRDGSIKGFVIILREARKVHRTLSRILGVQASYEFKDIIGKSDKIKNVIEFGKVAASSSSNVMIYGENGTGKELLAHAIHNYSGKNKPFIPVNCAAIPTELIESELFGYEKGSFTGALRHGKPGKFELANGGTIFLDEIGDMPLPVQSKILRIIEARQVFRIGSSRGIPINVKIISATNKDIKEEIAKKRFREDLYYRLNVLTIEIPPLRERTEDIPLLVDYFIKTLNRYLGKDISGVSERVMDHILSYHWPGNIRELRNFIERAMHFTQGKIIDMDALPTEIRRPGRTAKTEDHSMGVSLLKLAEKDIILQTLREFKGNKRKTAQYLGMGRATLYRKLKEIEAVQ